MGLFSQILASQKVFVGFLYFFDKRIYSLHSLMIIEDYYSFSNFMLTFQDNSSDTQRKYWRTLWEDQVTWAFIFKIFNYMDIKWIDTKILCCCTLHFSAKVLEGYANFTIVDNGYHFTIQMATMALFNWLYVLMKIAIQTRWRHCCHCRLGFVIVTQPK